MQKRIGTLAEQWDGAARQRAAGGTAIMPAQRLPAPVAPVRAAARPYQTPRYQPEPPRTVPPPVKAGKTSDPLREAARAVVEAWSSGELEPAVRALDAALGGQSMDDKRLRNLFHPSSYRKQYDVTLTGDELMRLQLLTNAASLTGPIGLTTYVIKPKEMAWARDRLRKIREAK